MFALPPGQDELIQSDRRRQQEHGRSRDLRRRRGYELPGWITFRDCLRPGIPGRKAARRWRNCYSATFSPSGKLPMTFDRRWEENPAHDTYYPKNGDKKVAYTEGIFVGYRGYEKSGVKPLFPFGYGLSYTTFAYKNLSVSPASAAAARRGALRCHQYRKPRRCGSRRSLCGRPALQRSSSGKRIKRIRQGQPRPGGNQAGFGDSRSPRFRLLRRKETWMDGRAGRLRHLRCPLLGADRINRQSSSWIPLKQQEPRRTGTKDERETNEGCPILARTLRKGGIPQSYPARTQSLYLAKLGYHGRIPLRTYNFTQLRAAADLSTASNTR